MNIQLKSSTDLIKPQARRRGIWQRFFLAVGYMTCLPLTRLVLGQPKAPPGEVLAVHSLSIAEEDLSGLAKYLTAVGLLIGIILSACSLCLTWLQVNNLLGAFVITLVWLVLTHGFHLDGLMDTADGIFSHTHPKRMLDIMQDSRVGNFGVMAGIICLLVKWISIYTLIAGTLVLQPFVSDFNEQWFKGKVIFLILLLVPAWARWAQSFAMGYFPYLREQGKGKIWHDSMCFPRDLWIGMLCPLAVSVLFLFCNHGAVNNPAMILLIFLTTAFTIGLGMAAAFWLTKKFGGHTGDTYGAVVELAEAGALLCLALFTR